MNGVTFSVTGMTCHDGAAQDVAVADVDQDDDMDLVVVGQC